MEIWIANPGQVKFRAISDDVAGLKWSYKAERIADKFKPREVKLTLPPDVPVKQFAEIIMLDSHRPVFRGYVENYQIDENREREVTVAGMERQLMNRIMPDAFYPEGTLFTELFSHTPTINKLPGMLMIADSLVAPGWNFSYQNETNNTVKLPGMGTASQWAERDLYFIGYQYLRPLTAVHDVDELAYIDLTYYRNASDLWVRIDEDYSRGWPYRGGLIVDGAFGTSIELGVCPADAALRGDLQTYAGEDKMADLMVDIIRSHEYYLHLRDGIDRLYLDITENEGST